MPSQPYTTIYKAIQCASMLFAMHTGKAAALILMLIDDTHIWDMRREMIRLARYNPLTGRPNRLLLMPRLRHILNRFGRDVPDAVLFVNLANFSKLVTRPTANTESNSSTASRLGSTHTGDSRRRGAVLGKMSSLSVWNRTRMHSALQALPSTSCRCCQRRLRSRMVPTCETARAHPPRCRPICSVAIQFCYFKAVVHS
ncbi:hypothetical protein ABH945_002164 [Paraburkholderia sp. GAS333]